MHATPASGHATNWPSGSATLDKLSDSDRDAVQHVLRLAEGLDLDRWLYALESKEQMVLRFCRARRFRVDAAFAMLRTDVLWRAQHSVDELRTLSPGVLLGLDEKFAASLAEHIQIYHEGYDRQGCPVIYKKVGLWRPLKFFEAGVSEDTFIHRFFTALTEKAMHDGLEAATRRAGHEIQKVVIVVDVKDGPWFWNLPLAQGLRLSHVIAGMDADHYPERLGKVLIINSFPMFVFGFNMAAKFFDERTKQKMRMLGDRSEWLPVFLSEFGEDQIPVEYGGTSSVVVNLEANATSDPLEDNSSWFHCCGGRPQAQVAASRGHLVDEAVRSCEAERVEVHVEPKVEGKAQLRLQLLGFVHLVLLLAVCFRLSSLVF